MAALRKCGGSKSFESTVRRLMREGDYLTACELIKTRLGNANFHAFCRSEFLTPCFQSAPIHDAIINLDSRIVATPNIDTIYENRVNALQHNSVAVKVYSDSDVAEAVRQPGRIVIKVHGTVNSPHGLIFTRSDYARARAAYRGFYSILEALAITHTFVFIGCGLSDPDMRLILEDYAFRFMFGPPHYFVIDDKSVAGPVKTALENSLNVTFLTYKHTSDHVNLLTGLQDLVASVEAKRSVMTIADW